MPPQLGSIYPMESQRTLLPVPASQYCPNPNPVSQSTNYFHFPETFPSQRFFPFSPLSPFPIDSIPPLPHIIPLSHIPFPPPLPFPSPLGYDALMPGLCCFMERQRTAFLPHSFPPCFCAAIFQNRFFSPPPLISHLPTFPTNHPLQDSSLATRCTPYHFPPTAAPSSNI